MAEYYIRCVIITHVNLWHTFDRYTTNTVSHPENYITCFYTFKVNHNCQIDVLWLFRKKAILECSTNIIMAISIDHRINGAYNKTSFWNNSKGLPLCNSSLKKTRKCHVILNFHPGNWICPYIGLTCGDSKCVPCGSHLPLRQLWE